MNQDWLLNYKKKNVDLGLELEVMKNQLMILELNETKYLIKGFLHYREIDNHLLLVCDPVLNDAKVTILGKQYSKPIYFVANNYKIRNNLLVGLSPKGDVVKFYPTDKIENEHKLMKHYNFLKNSNKRDVELYGQFLSNESFWLIEEETYLYFKLKYDMEVI